MECKGFLDICMCNECVKLIKNITFTPLELEILDSPTMTNLIDSKLFIIEPKNSTYTTSSNIRVIEFNVPVKNIKKMKT